MKALSTTILRHFVRGLGVVALCAFATAGTAFADNISKTFEFGPGTPQSRSHVRTFPVPCGLAVAATVKFQRLGPDGAGNDFPIKIDLIEPDTAAAQEGPLVETKSANARRTEQTVTLSSGRSNRGCSLPWRVRVRYANEGTAPFSTIGSIKLVFGDNVRDINVQGGRLGLNKGKSVTTYLGDLFGLDQGRIEITATWFHVIFIPGGFVPGASPIKLKFELIDPSGTVVRTVEAYSSNEARSELTRFKLTYQVANCVSGQWKVRITNNTNDDAGGVETKAKFTPDCPN